MQSQARVLIVDDEERFRNTMVKLLGAHSIASQAVGGGEQALRELEQNSYDVVILDMKMPGLTGKGVMQMIKERGYNVKVIVLTGHATVEDAVDLINLGAHDYLNKPCKIEKLVRMIQSARGQLA